MKTSMTVRELADALSVYADANPDALVWAHWQGWVLAPISAENLWHFSDRDLFIDCDKEGEKLEGLECKILGGVPVKRVIGVPSVPNEREGE